MPRGLKDGPMACSNIAMPIYTIKLKNQRDDCISLLNAHEKYTPDHFWHASDGPGNEPSTDRDKSCLKLATPIGFERGKPIFPPANTRLSDELVYLATKFIKTTDRGRDYPYDFQERGDIRPDRVPSGVGPIIWAHGLPFFPVFKGYYILCGREHAHWIGWMLHPKQFGTIKDYPTWTIGPVIAPGSAVQLARSVERQLRVHKPATAKEVDKGTEKNQGARDVVSMLHHHGTVVPRSSSGGFVICPLYRVQGYTIRVGPNAPGGMRANQMAKAYFKDNNIQDFDYDAALKVPYYNEKNPLIYGDDDDEEEEDDDTDGRGDEGDPGEQVIAGYEDEEEDANHMDEETNEKGILSKRSLEDYEEEKDVYMEAIERIETQEDTTMAEAPKVVENLTDARRMQTKEVEHTITTTTQMSAHFDETQRDIAKKRHDGT